MFKNISFHIPLAARFRKAHPPQGDNLKIWRPKGRETLDPPVACVLEGVWFSNCLLDNFYKWNPLVGAKGKKMIKMLPFPFKSLQS